MWLKRAAILEKDIGMHVKKVLKVILIWEKKKISLNELNISTAYDWRSLLDNGKLLPFYLLL